MQMHAMMADNGNYDGSTHHPTNCNDPTQQSTSPSLQWCTCDDEDLFSLAID